MIEKEFVCQYCGRSNFKRKEACTRHQKYCAQNPQKIKYVVQYKEDTLYCKYCDKLCKNKNSLAQHEIRCKENPDSISTSTNNFKEYQEKYGSWNKGLNKNTDTRVLKYANTLKAGYDLGCIKPTFLGKHHTSETKLKLSKSRLKYIEEHPEVKIGGYREGCAKAFKWGYYNDFRCDSSWELAFIVYCLDNGVDIKRNTQGFQYTLDNVVHLYYPDFIINNTYYEVKGKYDEVVYAKIKQFPYELVVIDGSNIDTYLVYVTEKYGNNFTETLYSKDKPSYLNT